MELSIFQRIILAVVIILIAAAISFAGGYGGAVIAGLPVFVVCAGLAFAVNWLAFIPANSAQTERYYDITGSFTYLTVIAAAVVMVPEITSRGQIAASLVVIWAVRLGVFLFKRINRDGQDDRFDQIKTQPSRFFIAWTLQALWVVLSAACALAIITGGSDRPIGIVGQVGLLLWCVGFICEVVADAQKSAFKRNPNNSGQFIDSGLWCWSQHPNYFGEILLWFGMAILAWPVLTGWQYLTLVSPLFVAFLLLKVSGIPLLTRKANERWGNDSKYQAYIARTSLLIPIPSKESK